LTLVVIVIVVVEVIVVIIVVVYVDPVVVAGSVVLPARGSSIDGVSVVTEVGQVAIIIVIILATIFIRIYGW
jgi:hypothetical protein